MSTPAALPYFPRPDLVDAIHQVLSSGLTDAVTMFAARRMGKTEFMTKDLVPAAAAWRWDAYYVDLWRLRSDPERGLVEALEEHVQAAARRGLPGPSKLTAKAAAAGMGIEAEWASPPPVIVASGLSTRLRTAMKALVGAGDRVVLLVLDEFQTLAAGTHEDFVAAFRAATLELRPSLKVVYTGSSRNALNAMFRHRKAPLFESAMTVSLPILDRAFSIDRAEVYESITGRGIDATALDAVFDEVGRIPKYLNLILVHMVLGRIVDPWTGFTTWLEAEGRDRLSGMWAALKPLDRLIVAELSGDDGEELFGAAFARRASEHLGAAITPQKVQAAVRRMVRNAILSPTGVEGGYEIEDRAFALHVRRKLQERPQ